MQVLRHSSFQVRFYAGDDTFVTNLNYVVVAIIGAVRISNGLMTLGDVQTFIQYSIGSTRNHWVRFRR